MNIGRMWTQIVQHPSDVQEDAANSISQTIRERGFVIVRPSEPSATELLALASALGTIQKHIRADVDGVVGERESVDRSWRAHKSEYTGPQHTAMPPHTDGSFLAGVTYRNERLLPVAPPRLVLLQCVQPANSGGATLVADGQALVAELARMNIGHIEALMTPGCATFCRDEQLSSCAPVIERLNNRRARLRFRYDSATFVAPFAHEAARTFHELTLDERFCHRFDLEPGEVLVLDNQRMLHGRDGFVNGESGGTRQMRRVWVGAYDAQPQHCVGQRDDLPQALDRYEPYAPLWSPLVGSGPPLDVVTGLTLDGIA